MRIPTLVLALMVAGCGAPPPRPTPPRAEDPAGPPPAPTPPPPAAPRFDPGDLDQLAEVYRRAAAGDNTVWAERGLATSRGLPDPAQVDRYYQAIGALAKDPAAWARFQEKVKGGAP